MGFHVSLGECIQPARICNFHCLVMLSFPATNREVVLKVGAGPEKSSHKEL